MKNLCFISAFLFLVTAASLMGQSVGINNPTPDPSAALDIESNDKGVLIPRITSDQRLAITGLGGGSPATGLLVYDTDKSSFYFFNGLIWVNLLDNAPDTDWTETPTSVYTSRNVGIGDGIDSPLRTLEVGGVNQQYIRVKSINHMRSGIEFMLQGTGSDWRIENSGGFLDFMVSPDDYVTTPIVQATITNSGKLGLGLGLALPARVLDAGGAGIQYLRVRSTDANANGIEFMRQGLPGRDWQMTNNNGFFDIGSSSDDLATSTTHATFTSTGRLGIGSLNPQKELHVIGTIRSSDLAGLGNRTILANSEGDLIASNPITQVWSVTGLAFYSSGPEFNYSTIAYNTTFNAPLFASVNLPQGAIVTSMTADFGDVSTTNDIRIILGRIEIPINSTPSVLAEIISSGSLGTGQIITDSIINNPIINNNLYAYVIQVNPISNWDGAKLNIRSVRINYLNP